MQINSCFLICILLHVFGSPHFFTAGEGVCTMVYQLVGVCPILSPCGIRARPPGWAACPLPAEPLHTRLGASPLLAEPPHCPLFSCSQWRLEVLSALRYLKKRMHDTDLGKLTLLMKHSIPQRIIFKYLHVLNHYKLNTRQHP